MKFGFNRSRGFRGDVWKSWHSHGRQILVWFDFCFMALQHTLGHFGRGQLPLPHCSWASLVGSLPVFSAHSFASYWQLLFLNQRKRENGRRIFFHDQISMKECAGRGERTRGRLHAKGTRFRSSYRARHGRQRLTYTISSPLAQR